jgi:hypothetical protein
MTDQKKTDPEEWTEDKHDAEIEAFYERLMEQQEQN